MLKCLIILFCLAAGKHVENKAHKKSGKDAKHHVETANKGQHGSISHKIADEEKALKKTTSMSEGNHQSHKKAAAHQEHAAKHAEAAKHKKTNVLKVNIATTTSFCFFTYLNYIGFP